MIPNRFSLFVLFVISSFFPLFSTIPQLPLEVGSYVVLDVKSGRVIDEKAKDEPLYPASCTKVATLLYILSKSPDMDLKAKVVIPKQAVQTVSPIEKAKGDWNTTPSYLLETDGSSVDLVAGEVVSLQDLLYGMMVCSGNDAANTLAYYWGNRSIDAFVANVNAYIASLGLKHTHFCNPNGLHHPDHVSSAYDLAVLTRKALEIPLFREIVKTAVYVKPKTNKQAQPQTWKNTNKLLKKGAFYLQECIGVKTGWHSRAQKCLVAAAENHERSIILVMMRHPDSTLIFKHAKSILDGYLKEKSVEKELVSEGGLLLTYQIPGSSKAIPVKASTAPFRVRFYPSEKPEFEAKAVWKDCFPPLSEKDEVGRLEIYRDKELVASLPLVPTVSIQATIGSRISQFEKWLITHPEMTALLIVVLLGAVVGAGYRFLKRKRRR